MTYRQSSEPAVWTNALLARAADDDGCPVMAFEEWYQCGLECYTWNLPRSLVKRAFRRIALRQKWSKHVQMWNVRAFIYGWRGGYDDRNVCRAPDYVWPVPDDPSWQLVVFVYRDGQPVLDWLHPVSRRFWSEENDSFALPILEAGELYRGWFVEMGFDVLDEMPSSALAVVGNPNGSNLAVVPGAAK